ncbi:SHOCT domain-containing protein [Spirillospora sp. NPDC052269]
MHPLLITAAEPGWHHHDGPGWWAVFPITFGLLWMAVIGFFAFQLVKRRGRGGWGGWGPRAAAASASGSARATRPEDLLAERFARGEVDEDEFHARMSALRAERD